MSRIGKKPIEIPEGVTIKVENQEAIVSGPKGQIVQEIHPQIEAIVKDGKIFVLPKKLQKSLPPKNRALWGLVRSLFQNAVIGVSQGFEKKLEITGIGYKAAVENRDLILNLGFTHPIKITAPEGIDFSVEKNIIKVSGQDKQKVGEVASIVRKIRKDDPYKGKGIKYLGEQIRKKVGKKAIAAK